MPAKSNERIQHLRQLLQERILVVDGAMGTAIQAHDLNADDFGGIDYDGCNEYLVISQPDIISTIHRGYLNAGADIIETNTFGSTPLVLGEYGLGHRALEISRTAAELAFAAATTLSTSEKPRFVAGSMGPTTKSIFVTGGVTWDDLAENYRIQATGLIKGGVDILLVETAQDTLNVKAAMEGIDRALRDLGVEVPVAIQGTVEAMGTLLCGQDTEAFYTSVANRDLLWVGLNCATGPEFMTDHIRTLATISKFPVSCIPNAGLPDEDGNYNETPEMIAAVLSRFAQAGWLNLVGGCCGTTTEHIQAIGQAVTDTKPRAPVSSHVSRVSGLDTLIIDQDTRPILVGERTNVLGSRLFKRLINDGNLDEAAEIGRRQVREGAHLLDVCLQDPDRDEIQDVTAFLHQLTRKIKAPIVLDSTDAEVIEQALKLTPGKSVINSINLEDGEGRFATVVPLAKRFGAALVVGCIDEDKEQAQAISRQRKLEIAQRSYNILTGKYGIPAEDIIFDLLVFPVGTGDTTYIGSGAETIEAIRMIKEALPQCKTLLGISNVSFGLPVSGREVLNAVMLHHCVQAGLDMAIVNTERLERYPSLSEEDRTVAENLIWWRGDDPIAAFAAHFRGRTTAPAVDPRVNLSLDERLSQCILDGSKQGLEKDLDLALEEREALEIINGPLMNGMDEVGRLFNDNVLIVAEVLQSAEAMKAAVVHLEPHMERTEASNKGKIVLATVKGDVHDIGKNLVEIILSNNGFQVINLGIKVPPQELITAFNQHKPDMIGLSGLLVKSAQMMLETAHDMTSAGIDCPILVGGAALSNRFTRLRIAPEYNGMVAYAKDAMEGLSLANRLRNEDDRRLLLADLEKQTQGMSQAILADQTIAPRPVPVERSTSIRQNLEIPNPPDLKLHVIRDYDLDRIFSYINPMMLYVRHLGFKGRWTEAIEREDTKALELRDAVRKVEATMLARSEIRANAVFKFLPAQSDGQNLLIYGPDGKTVLERFFFGRQRENPKLSLVDYVADLRSGRMDYVGMFITTVGQVRGLAEDWKSQGDYLDMHILQALALESAEGFAELLHQQMRRAWGFGDQPGVSSEELFKAHYQGRRYSFGYPACPRLEDQEQLFRLLGAKQEIGVELTEGYMMDPESSVSALVFHHPDATYFNLSPQDVADLELDIAGN